MIDTQSQGKKPPGTRRKKGKEALARAKRLQAFKELKARLTRAEQRLAELGADKAPHSHPLAADDEQEMDAEGLQNGEQGPAAEAAGDPGAAGDAATEAARLQAAYDELLAQHEALQAERAMYTSATETLLGGGDPAASRQRTSAAVDLTKVVNKPGNFDGTAAKPFHEWKNEVQMYLRVMKFPKDEEAGIVQSYLKGTALAWYMQKIEKLETADQPVPASWEQLLPLLNERFEHRNPELAARDKLMTLRQGSLTLHQYLKEFEGCYAYIPRWDEADKIHRFLFGLKPYLKAKFCVDPATHSWWTCFDSLVSYITSYMSDDMSHSADNLTKALTEHGEATAGGGAVAPSGSNKHKPNNGWQRVKSKGRSQKGLNALATKVLNALGVQGGGVQKPSGRPPGKPGKTYTNGNGQPVTRHNGIRSFCHQQSPQLCLGCFQPGHQVSACTAPVASGVPAGYTASR